VGILIKYKGASIYRVYMPSRARDKIVCSSHVRFNEGSLVTEPDFEAIKDEMVRRQVNQSILERFMNQDVKGLRLGPPAIDHVYDLSGDGISIQDDDTPPVEDDVKSIINAPEVSILLPPPSPKKKGRLKGSKNRITDNTPLENRRTTRAQGTVQDVPLVVLTTRVDDLDDKLIKDKGDAYYTAFLTGSETLKDPITLAKALSRLRKEVNEWREAVLKEYRSL
jgi:hypothetical protein